MNKIIELICKQNPTTTIDCGNPKCNNKIKFSTKEVLSKKQFNFICPKCKKETLCDTSKFIDSFERELKKLGITVK